MSNLQKIKQRFIKGLGNWQWRRKHAANEREANKKESWWNEKFGSDATKIFNLGRRIKLKLYADSVLCRVIDTKPFELTELRFIEAYLSRGDIFIDVGANIGLFTLLAAEIVKGAGQVHCFEPSSRTFSRLTENISRNGFNNVHTNQCALSNEAGELELYVSTDGHDAWNSLAGQLAGNEGRTEVVSVTTIDAYCQSRKLTPTIMKIDVEGWEKNVILGGREVFGPTNAPDLLVEFTEANCIAAGTSGKDLFNTIAQQGYSLFHLGEDFKLSTATADDDFGYKNLLATKDLRRVQQKLADSNLVPGTR
jgi:FkbM family methyltransferase